VNRQTPLMLCCLIGLLLSGASFLRYWKTHQTMGEPGVVLVEDGDSEKPPVRLPDWVLNFTGEDLEVSKIELEALPPDTTITRKRYKLENGFFIDLTVVLMGLDRTSIHKPQYCLTGAGFQIQETVPMSISIRHPVAQELPVMRLKTSIGVRDEGQFSGLLYYWFVDDEHVTRSHADRMWLMARDLFTKGKMQRWAYVTVSAIVYPEDEQKAYQQMEAFIRAAVPVFQKTLGETVIVPQPFQSPEATLP